MMPTISTPGEAVDPLRQIDRVAARTDADAVEADVHLDDHAARDPLRRQAAASGSTCA